MKQLTNNIAVTEAAAETYDVSRRRFLQLSGGIAGAGMVLSAVSAKAGTSDHYMGKGDIALLNLLYVLQQIEADFYTEAVARLKNVSNAEAAALMNMKNQEVAHAKTLKNMLGSRAVAQVPTNFSAVSFTDRASVLKHAAAIESMVVAGFNGAAGLFEDTEHALALSKMVMAEAEHSAYVNNKLSANSFGATVTSGLDHAQSPAAVMALAEAYTSVQFDKNNLPNHTNI